jgi:protein-glutamine gamma-glutamyltransferase
MTLPPVRRQTEAQRSWFLFQQPSCWPIARTTLGHGAKVINLKTNRVPAPPQFTSVHVDRLDQPDFWGWTDDGMAAMVVREHIPQLTVLHLRSQQVDLQVLREQDFTAALRDPEAAYLQTPTPQDSTAAKLAHEWTSGIPRGWQQVEAVVRRLREDFRLDPDKAACPESGDVVEQFLMERVGPAYCFATTAAVMLRHLGYPTRLVAGFYARPQRFDRLAGQTTVLAEDAHVWAEVCIDRNTWLTIEPTPGYQAPREAMTWQPLGPDAAPQRSRLDGASSRADGAGGCLARSPVAGPVHGGWTG